MSEDGGFWERQLQSIGQSWDDKQRAQDEALAKAYREREIIIDEYKKLRYAYGELLKEVEALKGLKNG